MALIAKAAILWRGRMYNPGEELPTAPADMVKAWLDCGSAVDASAIKPAAEDPDNADLTPDDQKMVTGHLELEQLKTMKKPELEKLARDMGVVLEPGDTKDKIAEKVAAVSVKVPDAGEPENSETPEEPKE